MVQKVDKNKRIAKNTIFLYLRMFIMMGVSLYTSRVVLQKLGIDDFGLYNIVGGVVVLFSILNSSLASSTQRFLNFELGKEDSKSANLIFQCSISLHFVICGLLLLLAETVGLWYVNAVLSVPDGRIYAANIVYQFSVLTFCLNVLRVPFNASIIAHEKMNFYAYISIVEAMLKLFVVYLLGIGDFDRLIFYAFLIMLVTCVIDLGYVIYCVQTFRNIKVKFSWCQEKIKTMLSFSGWNLFGSTAIIAAQQGINLVLNYFCGVGVNAAAGIANQVTQAMYGFITNFQTAFNPQIVKSYAKGEIQDLYRLIFSASKMSFLLFWLISLPVLFAAPYLLRLWLGQVPPHTISFCRVIIVFLLIDAINGPLWMSVNATGKIRNYQILMSMILFCNIPIAILMLWLHYEPETVWFTKVAINLVAMIARLLYLNRLISFPLKHYLKKVVFPIVCVVIFSFIPLILLRYYVNCENFIMLFIDVFTTLIIIFIFGINTREKKYLYNLILASHQK